MEYDFSTKINRKNCGSNKWNAMYTIKPDVAPDVVPMTVADMEFMTAPEIRKGLQNYIDSTILGYTSPTDSYYDAVISWEKRHFDYEIKREWIMESSGVVPALFALVEGFTKPSDGVLVMTPVYYPFYLAVERSGRKLIESPLVHENNYYTIDFEDLEKKAQDPQTTMLIFCSPHNPVGRVWKEEELQKVAEICARNHVLIISDEIHQDIIMPGHKQITMGNIARSVGADCIICIAPSKTFNLAGMQISNIILPNKKHHDQFFKVMGKRATVTCNVLGYIACEIAYTQCDEWHHQLIQKIDENRKVLKTFFENNLPTIPVTPLEGTYLMWADFRTLGYDYKKLEEKMQQEAEVFLDEGYMFGKYGEGFERFNIACPTDVLTGALNRIKQTFKIQ